MRVLDSSGDLVDEARDLLTEVTALPLTLDAWTYGTTGSRSITSTTMIRGATSCTRSTRA